MGRRLRAALRPPMSGSLSSFFSIRPVNASVAVSDATRSCDERPWSANRRSLSARSRRRLTSRACSNSSIERSSTHRLSPIVDPIELFYWTLGFTSNRQRRQNLDQPFGAGVDRPLAGEFRHDAEIDRRGVLRGRRGQSYIRCKTRNVQFFFTFFSVMHFIKKFFLICSQNRW